MIKTCVPNVAIAKVKLLYRLQIANKINIYHSFRYCGEEGKVG